MFEHKLLTVLCDEQVLMLRDMVRNFVNDQIMPVRQQIDEDENHIIVRQILQKLAGLGFLKNIFPEKYGGGGGHFPPIATHLALEEIARGDSGIAVALGCFAMAEHGRLFHSLNLAAFFLALAHLPHLRRIS